MLSKIFTRDTGKDLIQSGLAVKGPAETLTFPCLHLRQSQDQRVLLSRLHLDSLGMTEAAGGRRGVETGQVCILDAGLGAVYT